MSADQITRFGTMRACGGCSTTVKHTQVATFAGSGFKTYELVPRAHKKPDGAWCSFKADLRSSHGDDASRT